MSCNNYNANTQPKVQFAVAFPADYCHTTWQALAQAIMEALAGALPDNYSTFLISDSTPAASDRDKIWVSVDPSNCRPIGVKLYLNGSWVDIGANVFYGVDVSSVDNLIQVDATTPVVNWAQTGHVFFVKLTRANNGAATITIKSNGTAFYSAIPVRKWNNQPLAALDYIAGMIGVFVYDGVTNTMRLTNPLAAGASSSGGGSSSGSGHNLSFDDDVNEDGIPDKWRIFTSSASFTGAVGEAETAPASDAPAYVLDPAGVHGGKCIKFNCLSGTGNGGGFIQTEGHIEVVASQIQEFSWWVKTDADAISNRVEVLWYDADKVFISKTELWANSASNPNGAWFQHGGIAQSPSTAKFCRVRLYAGVSGTTVGGAVWFDDFRFQAPTFKYRILYPDAGSYGIRVPAGKFQAKFTVVGGGGAGGDSGTTNGTTSAGGGGGGGTKIFYAPVFGDAVIAVTVGAGGLQGAGPGSSGFFDGGPGANSVITILNPSAGSLCVVTAAGGVAGVRTNSAANGTGGSGGSGSVTGSDWSVTVPGLRGMPAVSTLTAYPAGHGGASSVGAGGIPKAGTTTTLGKGDYGGGGAGGAYGGSGTALGSDGAPGVIIVEYV